MHDNKWLNDSSLSSELHNQQMRDLYLFLKLVLLGLIAHLIPKIICFSGVLSLFVVRYGCGLSLKRNCFFFMAILETGQLLLTFGPNFLADYFLEGIFTEPLNVFF